MAILYSDGVFVFAEIFFSPLIIIAIFSWKSLFPI